MLQSEVHVPTGARRWADICGKGRPMPATKEDLNRLKGILAVLKITRVKVDDPVFRRDVIEALERAIVLLEENIASSPVFWILGALSRAWERRGPFRFIPADHDLNQWALEQLHQQMKDVNDDGLH